MEDKKEKYILFGANCIVDWIKEHDFYDIQGLNENTIDEDLYKDCLYFLNILNYLNITIPKHNSYGDYYGMFNSENYYKYNEDSLETLTKVFYNNKKDFKKIIKPIEKLNVILGNELATAYLEKNLDLENAYKMVINNSNKLDNEKLIGYIKKHVSLSLKRNIENNNYYGLKYEEYNFLIEYLQESLEFENIRMFINIKSIEDYDNLSLNTFTNAIINDIIKDVNENNLELLVKWLYDRESDYFVVNNKNLDKLNTILGDKEKTEYFIQSKDLENSFKGIKNYGENVYIEGIKKLNEDFNNNSIKEIKKPVWTRDLIKEKMYDELLKIIENNNYYVNLDRLDNILSDEKTIEEFLKNYSLNNDLLINRIHFTNIGFNTNITSDSLPDTLFLEGDIEINNNKYLYTIDIKDTVLSTILNMINNELKEDIKLNKQNCIFNINKIFDNKFIDVYRFNLEIKGSDYKEIYYSIINVANKINRNGI